MTRIERLISESYSGLHPSPALEDELLENLPADRRRPRRIARWLVPLAAVLVLAVAFAFNREEAGPGQSFAAAGDVELPVVARPQQGLVPRSNEETHVHLARGGNALVLEDGWTPVSLDGLVAHIRAAKHKRIIVHADRAAPWQHLQWLMLMCAEAGTRDVVLSARTPDGDALRLSARLPSDADVTERAVKVAVTVGVDDGKVRYSFGDRRAEELASVARWLAAARKATDGVDATVRGELKATAGTPYHHVVKVLGEFRQAGFEQVDFFGTRLPRGAERSARPWPAPGAAWPGAKTLAFKAHSLEKIDDAVRIIKQRVKAAGLNVAVQRDGDTVLVVGTADIQDVCALIEQQGVTLEFHLTVRPGAPNYEYYELRLRRALDAGAAFETARDIRPQERARDDAANGRYEKGLRWFRNERGAYTLCREDDHDITAKSFHDVTHGEAENAWGVYARVKPAHQAALSALTGEVGAHLAIVINDRVQQTARIVNPLQDAVQITGGYTEKKARALAALLGGEPLPVRFSLAMKK